MWKTLQMYVLYLFYIDYIHILLLCIEVISNLKICKCQSNYLLGWFDRLLVYSKAYLTVETLYLPSHELHMYLHVFRLMYVFRQNDSRHAATCRHFISYDNHSDVFKQISDNQIHNGSATYSVNQL